MKSDFVGVCETVSDNFRNKATNTLRASVSLGFNRERASKRASEDRERERERERERVLCYLLFLEKL